MGDDMVPGKHPHKWGSGHCVSYPPWRTLEERLDCRAESGSRVRNSGSQLVGALVTRSVPGGTRRVPAVTGSVPGGTRRVPAVTGSVPEGTRRVPAVTGSVPEDPRRVPAATGSVPEDTRRVPAVTRSVPGGTRRVPYDSDEGARPACWLRSPASTNCKPLDASTAKIRPLTIAHSAVFTRLVP